MHHLSDFPKTTKHLVSWWVQELASPRSEASGKKDCTTVNTVGSSVKWLNDQERKDQIPVRVNHYFCILNQLCLFSFRDWIVPHDPGVRLSAVGCGPHLQGGDGPGQEQGGVQGALLGLFQRTRQTKGTVTTDESACHNSLCTSVWVWNKITAVVLFWSALQIMCFHFTTFNSSCSGNIFYCLTFSLDLLMFCLIVLLLALIKRRIYFNT